MPTPEPTSETMAGNAAANTGSAGVSRGRIVDPRQPAERTGIAEQKADGTPAALTLHPRVYLLLVILAGWFALAVWGFAGGGTTDYLLFIVSGFIFVVVALMAILSRVGGRRWDQQQSFRDWTGTRFETWTGRQNSAQAAAEIVLPIATAAVGLTIIGIVFHAVTAGQPPA